MDYASASGKQSLEGKGGNFLLEAKHKRWADHQTKNEKPKTYTPSQTYTPSHARPIRCPEGENMLTEAKRMRWQAQDEQQKSYQMKHVPGLARRPSEDHIADGTRVSSHAGKSHMKPSPLLTIAGDDIPDTVDTRRLVKGYMQSSPLSIKTSDSFFDRKPLSKSCKTYLMDSPMSIKTSDSFYDHFDENVTKMDKDLRNANKEIQDLREKLEKAHEAIQEKELEVTRRAKNASRMYEQSKESAKLLDEERKSYLRKQKSVVKVGCAWTSVLVIWTTALCYSHDTGFSSSYSQFFASEPQAAPDIGRQDLTVTVIANESPETAEDTALDNSWKPDPIVPTPYSGNLDIMARLRHESHHVEHVMESQDADSSECMEVAGDDESCTSQTEIKRELFAQVHEDHITGDTASSGALPENKEGTLKEIAGEGKYEDTVVGDIGSAEVLHGSSASKTDGNVELAPTQLDYSTTVSNVQGNESEDEVSEQRSTVNNTEPSYQQMETNSVNFPSLEENQEKSVALDEFPVSDEEMIRTAAGAGPDDEISMERLVLITNLYQEMKRTLKKPKKTIFSYLAAFWVFGSVVIWSIFGYQTKKEKSKKKIDSSEMKNAAHPSTSKAMFRGALDPKENDPSSIFTEKSVGDHSEQHHEEEHTLSLAKEEEYEKSIREEEHTLSLSKEEYAVYHDEHPYTDVCDEVSQPPAHQLPGSKPTGENSIQLFLNNSSFKTEAGWSSPRASRGSGNEKREVDQEQENFEDAHIDTPTETIDFSCRKRWQSRVLMEELVLLWNENIKIKEGMFSFLAMFEDPKIKEGMFPFLALLGWTSVLLVIFLLKD